MLHSVIAARQTCSLLAVTCGSVLKAKCEEDVNEDKLKYPFPGLVSSGRLEVLICISFHLYAIFLYLRWFLSKYSTA